MVTKQIPVPIRVARDLGPEVVIAVDVSAYLEGTPEGVPEGLARELAHLRRCVCQTSAWLRM